MTPDAVIALLEFLEPCGPPGPLAELITVWAVQALCGDQPCEQ